MKPLFIYSLTLNVVSLLLFTIDKIKSKRGMWRTPERMLFLSAVLGGSVGALAGIFLLRHKSRKPLFKIGVPIVFVIQIALLYYFRESWLPTL